MKCGRGGGASGEQRKSLQPVGPEALVVLSGDAYPI